jgi:hypothetical protein
MRIDLNGPDDLNKIPTGARAKSAPAGLRCVSADDLLSRKVTRPDAIVERILYPGLTVFHGRPKSGKSWWALQAAIALGRGEPLAGALHIPQQRRVLYLALEEPEWRTAHRLQQLIGRGAHLAGVQFVYKIDPLLPGGAAQLVEHLEQHPVDVVIVDTFLAIMGASGQKGGNVVQGDYNAWNTLLEIAHRFNVALVVISHSRKGGGDITESMISTTGAPAAVDCLWQLRRNPEGKGEFEVLGREVEPETFELQFSGEEGEFGWKITAEGSEVGLSEARGEIVELLRSEGALKPGKIALLLKKNAVTVRRLLMKMADDNVVRRNGDGTYFATGARA